MTLVALVLVNALTSPLTAARPAPIPAPEATAERTARATTGPQAGVWAALAGCESGGDPSAVSPGGTYRGLYQFDYATWRSVGGAGDPAAASPARQTELAMRLHARRGWAPWPACSRALGLR